MFKKIIVLTLEEYKANWPIPTSANTKEQDTQLQMFIDDATNQIDNLCGGKLFRDFGNLDPIKDEVVIYKLQRAVGDLTLLLDQTGKMFYNSNSQGGGNAPFSLSTRSDNSQIEIKRQDIIKNLIEAGFYENVRIGQKSVDICDNELTTTQIREDFVRKLSEFFLRVDGSNKYQSNLMNFPNTCELNNTGDIIGNQVVDKNTQQMRNPILSGYDFNGNVSLANNANKVWDTKNQMFKFLSEFPISYFDGLTKQEIYNAIAASDKTIQQDIAYQKGWTGLGLKDNKKGIYTWYESLIDNNLANTPPYLHPNAWKELPINPIDLSIIINYVKEYLDGLKGGSLRVEGNSETKVFKTQEDYEKYKEAFGLVDSDFQDLEQEYYTKQETYNKQEVDSKEQNLNQEIETINNELDTCAKLDQDNTFVANNTFNNPIVIGTPTNNNHATTKEYVDNYSYSKSQSDSTFTTQTTTSGINDRVIAIETKLNNESFIDYKGEWNATTTYSLSDSISFNDYWYISKINDNVGHEPTGLSDQYWVLTSVPNNINLANYYDKQESDSRFAKLEAQNTFTNDNTFKQIKVKGTNNNNNYVLLDNFDWNLNLLKVVQITYFN